MLNLWAMYFIAAIFCIFVLYTPGFFFLRALKLDRLVSLVCSPAVVVIALCVISAVLFELGVRASFASVFLPAVAICLGPYLIGRLVSGELSPSVPRVSSVSRDKTGSCVDSENLRILMLYLLVGIMVSILFYVKSLDGPDSFVQTYDNVFHYGNVQSFLMSGNWSVLHCTLYPEGYGADVAPIPGDGYYPAAWHLIVALVASTLGASVPLAANAVNFILVGVVFPSGAMLLLRSLFGNNRVVKMGALATMVFGSFPWALLMVWPLFPNTASLAFLPAFIALVIFSTARGVSLKKRLPLMTVILVYLLDFAFLQPNSVFSAAVFLAPYCVWLVYSTVGSRSSKESAILAGAGVLAIAVLVWALLFKAPFLQGVVNYNWSPISSPAEALGAILTLGFASGYEQLCLALIVAIGAFALVKDRQRAWLVVSFSLSCLIYWVAATQGDSFVKHFLAGFWYTDPYRVSAFAAVFAIPLAAKGFDFVFSLLGSCFERFLPNRRLSVAVSCAVVSMLTGLMLVPVSVSLAPSFTLCSFGRISQVGSDMNATSGSVGLDSEEIEFLEEVRSVVQDDDLILNLPYDGSLFAYGVYGLNVYYREMSGYSGVGETWGSAVVRNGINEISTNPAVEKVIRSVDGKYVLLLKRDPGQMQKFTPTFSEECWGGFFSLNDETPGFRVVLKSGDMRLYEIL